jgi:hypothetical protein
MTQNTPHTGLVGRLRGLLAMVRSAHPGWDWAFTINPETFALLDIPAETVVSINPHTGARYTVRRLWGAELFVVQMVHEVVLCFPVGTPEQPGPWPATYYLDLGTGVVSTTAPAVS